jgi:hypothetical protein
MDQKPDRQHGWGKRNVEQISSNELMLAARYWAANTVIMSVQDPWRSHLFALVFAALAAPDAADLEAWLRHAHKAVRGTSLQTSPYEQARLELISLHPPWFAESAKHVPGMPTMDDHGQRWSRELRLNEMGRLLDEIKADGHLGNAPGGVLTI